MKTVVAAYHNIGCTGIEALLRHGFEIQAVFTHVDRPDENIWFRSVARLAASRGLPVHAPQNINQPFWVSHIRALAPDLLFSFYYRDLISGEILDIPRLGGLNLHGSLLPRYRGRCPINWVLIHGERETGVTLHYMTPRPDDGDIVSQKRIAIDDDDTARSLSEKADRATRKLLDETLPRLRAGTAPRTPQDASRSTYFGGRRPEDGRIDWTLPAEAVRNLVRAVADPYPGAFTLAGKRKLFVWVAGAETEAPGREPGTVVSTSPFVVACGRGALRIDQAQVEGSVPMTGAQAAAELDLVAGFRLDAPASRGTP